MSRNIFIKRIICFLVFMFAVSSIAVISVKAQEVKRIVQVPSLIFPLSVIKFWVNRITDATSKT